MCKIYKKGHDKPKKKICHTAPLSCLPYPRKKNACCCADTMHKWKCEEGK